MKKTLKIFAASMAAALAICSFAFASSADTADTADVPKVVSANISYEGDYAILLAVDAATVKGGSVTASIWDEAGELVNTYTDSTTETIAALDAAKTYYVVKTHGIAQKDMDKEFTYQVTDADGNAGEIGKISVAEYFYTRLFDNGIIDAKEGVDAVRRDFYIDTLEHGAKAQNLLYNYNDKSDDDITVFVTDLIYASVPGLDKTLLDNKTTTVTLGGEGSYTVTKYAQGSFAKSVAAASAGDVITIDAHTVVTAGEGTPEEKPFEFGQGQFYKNEIASSNTSKYDYTSANVNLEGVAGGAANNNTLDTATLVNGQLVYTRFEDSVGQSYIRWNNPGALAEATSLMYVFETDFMFDDIIAASEEVHTIRFNLNGGANMYVDKTITPTVSSVDEIAQTLTIGSMELNEGEWYNIRFAFDFTAKTLSYYVNGTLVGSEAFTTAASGSSNRVLWYYKDDNTTSGKMYYDNSFLGWVEKPVEIPAFVAGSGVYYTGGSFTKYDGASTSPFRTSNYQTNQAVTVNTLTENSNSVVAVEVDGANSGGGASYIEWRTSNNVSDSAYKYVFESDFKFDSFTATSTDLGNLQFRVDSSSISLTNTAANVGEVTSLHIGKMKLDAGEWYNIRFVIDLKAGEVEYFVNGVSLGSESYTAVAITDKPVRFIWNFNTTTTFVEMSFDNLTFGLEG